MCDHKFSENRRNLLKSAVKLAATAGVSSQFFSARGIAQAFAASEDESSQREPHFFLMVNTPYGLDTTYLFDARPLQMTERSLQVNYHGKDPIRYTGTNGVTTLRTSLMDPFMKWSSRFSVINGVVMSPNFEGHDQNMNILLTGNPFGGSSFVPKLNLHDRPLDLVRAGNYFASIDNLSKSIDLNAQTCTSLSKKMGVFAGQNIALDTIRKRAERIGTGRSTLARTAAGLASAAGEIPALASKISQLDFTTDAAIQGESDVQRGVRTAKNDVHMIAAMMQKGIVDSGELIINVGNLDTHDGTSAKQLPERVGKIAEILTYIFDYLDSQPSPSGRTLLDDTTILFASEFSRTMRQNNVAIDTSGTDHNPQNNSLIIGGKGIKGGLVIGASDFQSPDEVLSGWHSKIDEKRTHLMGRPFDVQNGQTLDVAPTEFDPKLYLQPMSVTNALQDLFKVSLEHRMTYGRNLPVVPSLKAILA